jgi:hypothetical protein
VVVSLTETQKLKIYQHHKRDFQISKKQNIVSLKPKTHDNKDKFLHKIPETAEKQEMAR